jgi:adenylate kinase
MHASARTIIFLGPPGAGKGTQAARVSAALHIPAISTGDMLRRECQTGSELGRQVETVLRAGQLVGDAQMNQIVEARLRERDCESGCILDGFPRTTRQATFLDALLSQLHAPRPSVLNFTVSAEQLIERLRGRRQCPTCGRIYGAENPGAQNPTSSVRLLCQNDHSVLIPRADDQPAAIRERLRIHDRNNAEILRYYQGRDCHHISAECSPEAVTDQIFEALGLACTTSVRAVPRTRYALTGV